MSLRVKTEKADIDAELANLKLLEGDDLDITAICGFARYVLEDSASTWFSAHVEHQQQLQRAFFPNGVFYSHEKGFELPSNTFETSISVCYRDQKNLITNGAPGVIRTHGLLVRSQTLYPAELRAH